ncbi:MAG TPA: hypothetical protein VGF30_08500 [Bacteroidia bacterium]
MSKIKYTQIAFIFALTSAAFFAIGYICNLPNKGILDASPLIPGLLMIISGLTAIIGTVYTLIGLKESDSYKKIAAIIINFVLTTLFLNMTLIGIQGI